ncbi:ETEC_3214 domain-containing protein [Enterovibrio sp. 27052020O]|uniref:ETEC_3214 domain-containing protein n=1 Tax=Enterovibrio sp. 27052020O TaxID=3241166 RepID=UPI00389041F6
MSVVEVNEQKEALALETAQQRNLKDRVREKWAKTIAFVSIIAIALGGLNDTMDAIDKVYNLTLSQFTDIPSHNNLARIYIRASEDVLEETFGAPVYIKKTMAGDVIKYYDDRRFVLSAVTRDGAISAFLVFPKTDYKPNTIEHAGGDGLLETVFSTNESVSDIRVNFSRSVSYYIEENTTGTFSNLYSSVAGYSEFLEPLDEQKQRLLSELSDGLMLGDDITEMVVSLRNAVTPNFYGYSNQGLEVLESAILTLTEYRLITKQ